MAVGVLKPQEKTTIAYALNICIIYSAISSTIRILVLGVDYLELIINKEEVHKPTINGFVEYNEKIYKIASKEDLENLLNMIGESE